MNARAGNAPIVWRAARVAMRAALGRTARRVLTIRALADAEGREVRWLRPEIAAFLDGLEAAAAELRPHARLEEAASLGNRLMVEFAVYTLAAERRMRALGIAPDAARAAVADIGWAVYRRMLLIASLPFRATTRDPGLRLRRTIGQLLRFPFNAPGAPGYAVETRIEDGRVLTHFTHCPPQSFARRVAEVDPEALLAFRESWCRYDWPGADLIAGDGRRGHYRRSRTLSHGDPVCDMCWAAHGDGKEAEGA